MLEKEKISVLPSFIEEVVEIKNCKHCGAKFEITDKDLEFYEKVSPIFNIQESGLFGRPVSNSELIKDLGNGKIKYLIPTPSLCPDCRMQRRMTFRNFMTLHKRKCSATGEDIVSMYSSESKIPVYNLDLYRGDNWSGLDYSMDLDFKKSIISQIKELHDKVPKANLLNMVGDNVYYCNGTFNSKESYLIFGGVGIEDCLYGHIVWFSKKCISNLYIYKCELCYECVDCFECYRVFYGRLLKNCSNSSYLYGCDNCEYCYGCVGLKNKKYYILNKKYSKKEYEEKIKNLDLNNIVDEYNNLKSKLIVKYYDGHNSENINGNHIYDSKNISLCYDIKNSEDLKYCATIGDFKDSYDCNYSGTIGSLMYETLFAQGYKCSFSYNCGGECRDIFYCSNCFSCLNCFGCDGLKNKSYCILNKQYTKEEYEELVPKIIEHMIELGERGEFFPGSFSPFGYNETVAEEYFPMTREEVINNTVISSEGNKPRDLKKEISPLQSKGQTFLHGLIFNRSDYESPKPNVDKIIPASKLPEDIADIPDDILNWAIECEVTKKPFRIIREELEFYRKHNLPIPRRHPDQRHLDRMKLRNPRKLYDRNCDKCGKDIKTTYSPERPEIVYCEECYNKEVY